MEIQWFSTQFILQLNGKLSELQIIGLRSISNKVYNAKLYDKLIIQSSNQSCNEVRVLLLLPFYSFPYYDIKLVEIPKQLNID